MKQNIIHIGLDVDDIQYHGAAFNKEIGAAKFNTKFSSKIHKIQDTHI